jgi:hypothetical protein
VALVCELTIPNERSPIVGELSAKFKDRVCRVVSATDLHCRILGFLDRELLLAETKLSVVLNFLDIKQNKHLQKID